MQGSNGRQYTWNYTLEMLVDSDCPLDPLENPTRLVSRDAAFAAQGTIFPNSSLTKHQHKCLLIVTG